MSGHSKWAQIKRQKGVNDARRGQLFTKLGREISVAARQGGGDPEANFRLRMAVQKAKESNMPAENIDRAIKKGAGGAEGANLEELVYEGYGPNGTAILLQALTDNRNRTVAEVRAVLTRGGGSLGEAGCVSWVFDQKGLIQAEVGKKDPEELALQAIDAGADDVKIEDGLIEIYTEPADLDVVRKALEGTLEISTAEISMIPKTTVSLDEKSALQLLKIMDKLEDLDDVQRVFVNADITDEVMEKYEG